jgi:hypothetical protein
MIGNSTLCEGTLVVKLKSWESPRSGRRRNDKSKQASAKLRQIKKRNKQLRNRLKKAPGTQPGVIFLPSLSLEAAERLVHVPG